MEIPYFIKIISKMRKKSILGILYIVIFLLFANANAVYSGNLLQDLNPFVFLFYSFIITSVFFALILKAGSRNERPRVTRQDYSAIALVNFTSAMARMSYFIALHYIEPAIVSAFMGGMGPISTIILGIFISSSGIHHNYYSYIVASGMLIGVIILIIASFTGNSGIHSLSFADSLTGLTAGMVGGIFQALNTISTKRLGNLGWSASRIMAHRFYLLIVISAFFVFTGPGFAIASSEQALKMIVAAVLGVIVPLWFLQRGIILSNSFTVAILLAWAPILTFLFQFFDQRLEYNNVTLLGCSVIVISTFLNIYNSRQRFVNG